VATTASKLIEGTVRQRSCVASRICVLLGVIGRPCPKEPLVNTGAIFSEPNVVVVVVVVQMFRAEGRVTSKDGDLEAEGDPGGPEREGDLLGRPGERERVVLLLRSFARAVAVAVGAARAATPPGPKNAGRLDVVKPTESCMREGAAVEHAASPLSDSDSTVLVVVSTTLRHLPSGISSHGKMEDVCEVCCDTCTISLRLEGVCVLWFGACTTSLSLEGVCDLVLEGVCDLCDGDCDRAKTNVGS